MLQYMKYTIDRIILFHHASKCGGGGGDWAGLPCWGAQNAQYKVINTVAPRPEEPTLIPNCSQFGHGFKTPDLRVLNRSRGNNLPAQYRVTDFTFKSIWFRVICFVSNPENTPSSMDWTKHSRVPLMQLAQMLPKQSFSPWSEISRFFILKGAPLLLSSSVAIDKLRSLWPGTNNAPSFSLRERQKKNGVSTNTQIEIEECILRVIFKESVIAANAEALICIKKRPPGAWGKCEDYDEFVSEFAANERQRIAE
ncbi:hypothetical protein CIHG_04801 [Coccidioides immitis H538.4]|uniref:Uncharacterized protein n=3 Tax=Coccidioides immitis TaxID=5501 RepID=A0A0J8QSW7_COCIT|nr:hypothetical protein CIRG_05312 [Coccidioides immitis RMSCC 2394]KMU74363.1 hypothetical protein CISG_04436 [Coccidioides immitis RMSCC 3703]KMU86861.1 hypothetical protein CIHG_04801 [Coccidioides immitis H538.4]